jgi:hypothetical protein
VDSVNSYDITITSFESSVNGVSVTLHPFETNSFFICTTTSYTENLLSSNIVGQFSTTINYIGTVDGLPDPSAVVTVNYTGVADYIGYTTLGNYYSVVRYTLSLPINYPSPPYPGFNQPLITDFSRIYYDTNPTFSNNQLMADPINGTFQTTQYMDDTNAVYSVQYVYSVSVDDRTISTTPNSVRVFMVVLPTTNNLAVPPTSH